MSYEVLRVVGGIMLGCQRRTEVERVLAAHGRQDKKQLDKKQVAITTHANVMRALSVKRNRLETEEEDRALLLQKILKYVCNSVTAAQAGCKYDQGFKAELISWIQKSLIPPLRETFAIRLVVSACLTEGGQLQHLMSHDAQDTPVANAVTAALPVASTSNFTKYQHQRDCC